MTMPLGSTEEPTVEMVMEQSIPVRVISSGKSGGAAEFGRWRSFAFAPSGGAQRIANRSLRRKRLIIKVNSSIPIGNGATPSQPAVPASTVAQQNTNPYPVLVTLTGFTLTAVTVNGVQVGTTNGSYIVPSGGTIAVTYTVVGTWVWANGSGTQTSTDGIFVVDRDTANNITGPAAPVISPVSFQNGGYLQINDNVRWECQQELWAIPIPGNSGTVYITVSDEIYASDRERNGSDD
jgi:hypothetical protein